MPKSVAILGCGPAGLLAAHAANLNGCNFDIFSKNRPSQLFGCQYLHEPIPGLSVGLPERVNYVLEGSPDAYRAKVYGDDWDGNVSPEELDYSHYAWDIRRAYRELWKLYENYILDTEIKPEFQSSKMLDKYDLVLSTVPRKIWKQPGDVFESVKIWAVGDAPELGQECPIRPMQDFNIICDGTEDVSWYRTSMVFGYATAEWPGGKKPPVEGVALLEKPLRHNSKGAADFTHLGRYGKWEKGVLTTDAFNEAMKAVR